MMIGKRNDGGRLHAICAKVSHEPLRSGQSAEDHRMAGRRLRGSHRSLHLPDRLSEPLETFERLPSRHYQDVGAAQCRDRFPQPTSRHQGIRQVGFVHQDDVELARELPVLESVVQQVHA